MFWKLLIGWSALITVFELIRRSLWQSSQHSAAQTNCKDVATTTSLISSADLHTDIERCWQKDIKRTALCADLPRFAWKIAIHTPDHTILHPPENTTLALRHLFLTLHRLLDGTPDDYQRLDILFTQLFPDPSVETHVDLSKCVDAYLQRALGTTQSSLYRLLTSCGQHIVAPAIHRLKTVFSRANLPFKDVRGGWYITIQLATDTVTVTHRKREQSREETPSNRFEFVWELRLCFDRRVQTLQRVSLYITDIYLPAAMPEPHKVHIRQVISSFFPRDELVTSHVL
jgi:hypothetical protein